MRKPKDEKTGETLKIEDYPIGTRLSMNGGDVNSIWKVISHTVDEDGDIVKVKIARDNKFLNNMAAEVAAGNTCYVPVTVPDDDAFSFQDEDPQDAPSKPENPPVKVERATKVEKGPADPAKTPRKKFLNTSEIAERTGMTPKDILAAISSKKLEAEKDGRTYVAAVRAVDDWAKAARAEARDLAKAKRSAEAENDKTKAKRPIKVKAAKDITGEKDDVDFSARGKHLKVPIREVSLGHFKADERNPFPVGGRLYGYFQAFIDGNGEATYDAIFESYLKMKDRLKMESSETDLSVKRDLDNHISAWKTNKTGPRGLHLHIERIDGSGRIVKGEKGKSRYRLIGFKDGSPYAEKAREMRW